MHRIVGIGAVASAIAMGGVQLAAAQNATQFDLQCKLANGKPAEAPVSIDLTAHRYCIGAPDCVISGEITPGQGDLVQLSSGKPDPQILLDLKTLRMALRTGPPSNPRQANAFCQSAPFTPFGDAVKKSDPPPPPKP